MSDKPPRIIKALTFDAPGIVNEIITDIEIVEPQIEFQGKLDDIIKVKALWDTGATGTCITRNAAEELGLIPTGMINVATASGLMEANTYIIDLFLPNDLVITQVAVSECVSLTGKFDVIIGMDIITIGDFAITNYDGKTKVSFRIPSVSPIDFVEEINRSNRKRNNPIKGSQRNRLCQCGSGLKYKYCHGKSDMN